MKAVIYGAGAIGGWMGVKLAQAGHKVGVVARGATLGALQQHGLRLIEGDATQAVLHQNGASTPMRRVDAATAERLRRATAAKVRNQTPNPASEAMLRHVIDGIVAGKPNLQEMNPQLGAAIRHDLPRLQVKLGALGPLQSLRLLSVSAAGMDVYEVQHEHGTSEWGIALDASGKLVGATVPL